MSVALPIILRTSSFRLTLLYAGLFGVSVLILLEVVYWATGVYISNSLDAAIDSDITELEESLRAGGIEALAAQVKERVRQMPDGPIYYLLESSNGEIIVGNLSPFHGAEGRFYLKVPRTSGPSLPVRAHGITLTGEKYLMRSRAARCSS